MAQETTTKQQQKSGGGGGGGGAVATQDEITPIEEEIEEIEIPQKTSMMDKMKTVMEKFASTGVGQVVFERCDRVLKVLEETAKWSLPQDDSETKLERPLPWMFFIPLIVWLRVIRFWLSFGSIMVGGPSVTPEAMVYNIQIKRRRLRAIRVPALRSARRSETDTVAMSGSSGKQQTLSGKLRTLFGSAICRPGQHRDAPARRVFGDKSKTPNKDSTERSSVKRPRDDDSGADLNLTVDEMLNKYANEDSDDDSDYVPNADEDDDSVTSSSDSISSTEEIEKEMPEKSKETSSKESSKNEKSSLDQSVVEVKENGGPKHRPMPKPLSDIKLEPISDADSGNEQVKTPRQQPQDNAKGGDAAAVKSQGPKQTNTEVAVQQHKEASNVTPTQKQKPEAQRHLTVSQDAEAKQKSTPGHETAATLKPAISVKTAVGSPHDFHTIFQPAPIIKVSPVNAHSTPKETTDHNESSPSETTTDMNPNHKKPPNKPNPQQQQQQQHNFYNNKNRNKNRR